MTFTLRDYQLKLVDETEQAMASPGAAPCLVAPTGSGKTVMLAELVRRARARGEKVLVAAHRNEIIKQILASLNRHLDEPVGICSAAYSTELRDVMVAMVPTLARRKRAVQSLKGRTFFLDEAHHICADSYKRIWRELEPLRFVGATATPITPTGGGLGKHGISQLILGPEPHWLMSQGALCNYKLYGAPAEVDISNVKVRGGDYATDQLNERIVAINGSVIRDFKRFNPDVKPTIAVTVSIDHAFELQGIYEEAGYSAKVVIGSTSQNERQEAFKRFESGELKVIVSVALIDEGLDLPAATCLQLLRPTRSIRLYRQLIGRVLRPAEGKSHALIIDHGGSWRHLPLPDEEVEWSLSDPPKRPAVEREVSEEREVKAREPLVAQGDQQDLVLINTMDRLRQSFEKRQAKLRRNLFLARSRTYPAYNLLKQFADNPQGVSPDQRREIEELMGLEMYSIDKQPCHPV